MKRPIVKLLQWGVGMALVILLFLLGDVSQLANLPRMLWGYVLLVFLCNVGFTLVHNLRWKEIIDHLPSKGANFFSLYRSLIDSYAVGKIIPLDVTLLGLRTYYLTRFEKMQVSLAVFSVLLDRFLDLLLLLTLALPSFLVITGVASITQSTSILILLLVIQGFIISWKKKETFRFFLHLYRNFLVQWIIKIPFLRSYFGERSDGSEEGYPFHLSSVVRIMGWNYMKYIFLCLRFYCTGLALGIQLPLLKSFFFIPFVQLSGLINITPGGIGVVEFGTYGALYLIGISHSQILLFVVGQRILLFLNFLVLFVMNRLFHLVWLRGRKAEGLEWK